MASPAQLDPSSARDAEPEPAAPETSNTLNAPGTPGTPGKPASKDREEAPLKVAAVAAPQALAPDRTADPGPVSPLAAAPSAEPSKGAALNATTVADAIGSAEPVPSASAPLRLPAVQELTVRIAQPDSPAVDVRLVERAGQVQVTVRTPDAALQSSLRQDLPALVNSLERAGFHAETFTPHEVAAYEVSSANPCSDGGTASSREDSQQSPSRRGGANDSPERRQHHNKPRGQNPRPWLEELEKQS